MGRSHDQAAQRIANKIGGEYDPTRSPDVRALRGRVEMKSADEISEALRQLGGSPGSAYIALPKQEHDAAGSADV